MPGWTEDPILHGGGECGALMRSVNWLSHPLGEPAHWPSELRTVVGLALGSKQPMLIVWGPEQTTLYNDGYALMCGKRHPLALGRPFRELWFDIWDTVDPIITAAYNGISTSMDDIEFIMHRNGHAEEAHFAFSYTPVRDSSGGVLGMFCACAERTKEVLAERRLVEESNRQRELLQHMPGFVAILNGPDHVFDYVNQAYVTMAGARDFIGCPVRDVLPEVRRQGFFEMLDHVYRTGEPVKLQSAPIRFAGESADRFLDFLYTPRRDESGAIVGIFAGGYDNTDGVRAQRALRDANDTLERRVAERTRERDILARVFEATDSFVHVIDLEFRWLAINPAGAAEFARVYGISPRVGDRIIDLLADQPAQLEKVRAIWERALSGEEFTTISDYGDPGRATHTYEMKFNRLYDDAGHRIGAYQIATNIDERIASQRALAEAQDSLRQAQKMEAVGQLTGGIAHDFNNILAVVSGSIELMSMRLAQGRISEVQRYVTAAEGATRRAAALTQRLLAFSRRQTLEPKPADLNEMVGGMVDIVNHSVGPEITVETVAMAGLWPTFADVGQLENALLNLCLNARDAMPEGGRIIIETANRSMDQREAHECGLSPGQYVALSVTDTGHGMPPEVRERAFDPFFTTKPLGQGTGLGLSMVHGIAGQSGGAVRICSEIGHGTTVSIYLPRHSGSVETGDREDHGAAAPRANGAHTVLLVDDEPLIRMVAAEHLQELGYAVLEAADANGALRVLGDNRAISLLISDVGLPGGMNGRQLAEAARQARPDLKVLFITGYAEHTALNPSHLKPGMHVMSKPFQMDAFARLVQQLTSSIAG